MSVIPRVLAALALAAPVGAQTTDDPFPDPIPRSDDVIQVDYEEFAVLPDLEGVAARMMLIIDEPGTSRLFVNDMRGPLYSVSYNGMSVLRYLNVNAEAWGVRVQSSGRERGFHSFAFHPQFAQSNTPGFGKFYTWADTENTQPTPDFRPGSGTRTHDTVLLEWTARTPGAATYDGGLPRELIRVEQPFANHNGGRMAFNPVATPGDADSGLLYVGLADGGGRGNPSNSAQDLGSVFGKILRIDPLGSNSANGRYGIPETNPFAADQDTVSLGEIFAYGVRNAQHFAWDPSTERMYVTDIGQSTVEELNVVTVGANLGWNRWEGSFLYADRSGVSLENQRGDPAITYPVAEFAQPDSLFMSRVAVTGLVVYRGADIPALANLVLFGDLPGGEILYIPADGLPNGGQDEIRRVLLAGAEQPSTLLEVIQTRQAAQGKTLATRVDLRMYPAPQGQVFLLNKGDGVIRVLVPGEG